MKFDAFDKTEQARFAAEVKEKWGGTAAYQEYQQREKDGSAGDFAELMAQFTELGKLKNLAPAAPEELAAAAQPGAPVLAGYPGENGKMTGLSPEFFREACRAFDHVLCEADGSRRMPLKFHREDEPCIPAETGLLLQVAGLSALGRPAAETLHRHALSGIAAEHCITEEDVAHLMLRAFSHCGVSCPSAALLNQADTPELCARGETVARLLRAEGYPCAVGALRKEVIGCWS